MSTASAPWRTLFLTHISHMPAPNFTLASIARRGALAEPRLRTVVFRGMWACLPVNPKNTAPLNPPIFTSDLPTLTTDARMEKTAQIIGDAKGSGVGGPVEAVFWSDEDQTQWRFKGRAAILGPDIDSDEAAPVREALRERMVPTGEGGWSWAKEVTAHFGNLSPLMRGSFRNPPPGTPRDEKPEDGLGLGQRVQTNDDGVARGNFRVVVLLPEEVERLDLSDPECGRRWNYKYEDGGWSATELWP